MSGGCLPDETLFAYTRDQLSAEAAAEARTHLKDCATCRDRADFLAPTHRSMPGSAPRDIFELAAELAAPIPAGEQVGRYRVLRRLGMGGMGVVYMAYDPELDRNVALKLLRPEATGQGEERLRLLREAQAMARLSHPNVVAVHDVGTFQDRVFVTMDLVEGQTLAEWLGEKPRTWREVLAKFREAGKGLSAAHAAGLIHRDFKPDNVLVGKDGRVQVTDFGLARARALSPGGEEANAPAASIPSDPLAKTPAAMAGSRQTLAFGSPLTLNGAVMGTPAYMAPEQILAQPLDERSDVFSFSVALYEALHGERPFASPTAVLEGKVTEPSRTGVPKWLRRATLVGLARDPAQRYPSIDALLEAIGKDPAVVRQRWALVSAAALLVLFAGFAGFRARRLNVDPCAAAAEVWSPTAQANVRAAFEKSGAPEPAAFFTRTSQAMLAASQNWSSAREQTCAATRKKHEQPEDVMLLRLSCLERQRIEMAALVELLSQASRELVEKSTAAVFALPLPVACTDPSALATFSAPLDPKSAKEVNALQDQLARARALLDVGKNEQAASALSPIATRAAALNDLALEANARFVLGQALHGKGDEKGASEAYKRAVYSAEDARADELAARAAAALVLTSFSARGSAAEARAWGELARILLERKGGGTLPEGDLEHALGAFLNGQEELDEALPHARRAVDLRVHYYGPHHPESLRSMNSVAAILGNSDRYDEAIALLKQALQGYEAVFGPDATSDEVELINLGWVQIFTHDFAEAERSLARAAEIDQKHPRGIFSVAVLEARARLAIDEHQVKDGLALLDETEKTLDGLGIHDGPWVSTLRSLTALAHLTGGDFPRAVAESQALLAVQEKLEGPDSSALVQTLENEGEAFLGARQFEQAVEPLDRARTLAQRHHLPRDRVAKVEFALARALEGAHRDHPRAVELADSARTVFAARPYLADQLKELDSWRPGSR